MALSPDGRLLVLGGLDTWHVATADVWDLTVKQQQFSLRGQPSQFSSAAFSPNGQRIVTAGLRDRSTRLWDASMGRELLTLKGGQGSHATVFSPDGQRIATASKDGTVRVWTAASDAQDTAWQKEEEAAARQLEALEGDRQAVEKHERARLRQDEGAIKRWLVLGPIKLTTEQDATVVLDEELIPREDELTPSADEAVTVGDEMMNWRGVRLPDYEFDFGSILGADAGRAIAYAVCYIESEDSLNNLQLITGNRHPAKIYLNGQEVYKRTILGIDGGRDTVANLTLSAGVNVLLVKSVNVGGSWPGSVRLTDAAGNPVKRIRVVLAPTAQLGGEGFTTSKPEPNR